MAPDVRGIARCPRVCGVRGPVVNCSHLQYVLFCVYVSCFIQIRFWYADITCTRRLFFDHKWWHYPCMLHAHQIIILNPTGSPDVENRIVHGSVSKVRKEMQMNKGVLVARWWKLRRVVRAFPPVHQGCCNVVRLKVMALCPCACVPGMSTPPPRAHHVLVACAVFGGGRACLPYPFARFSLETHHVVKGARLAKKLNDAEWLHGVCWTPARFRLHDQDIATLLKDQYPTMFQRQDLISS